MATETAAGASPFGIEHVWAQGDLVARATLIVMLIMSAWSWWVILTKLWDQRKIKKQAAQAEKEFWTGKTDLRQAAEKLKGKNHVFRILAEDGIRATQHHEGKLTDQIPLNEWINNSLQRSLDSIINRLQSGLAVLATVGSTAPFVGLFGTVWGILNALLTISREGQATIDKISGPVGEALIMTAIGLFVAVPAVMFYNALLRQNKIIIERLKYFATDLHDYLLSGSRIGDKLPPVTPTPPRQPSSSAIR